MWATTDPRPLPKGVPRPPQGPQQYEPAGPRYTLYDGSTGGRMHPAGCSTALPGTSSRLRRLGTWQVDEDAGAAKLRLLPCCSLSHVVCADAPLRLPAKPHVIRLTARSPRSRDASTWAHPWNWCTLEASRPAVPLPIQSASEAQCPSVRLPGSRLLPLPAPSPERHLVSLPAGQSSVCLKCIEEMWPLPATACQWCTQQDCSLEFVPWPLQATACHDPAAAFNKSACLFPWQ